LLAGQDMSGSPHSAKGLGEARQDSCGGARKGSGCFGSPVSELNVTEAYMVGNSVEGDCTAERDQSLGQKNGGEKVDVVKWQRFSEGLNGRLGVCVDDDIKRLMLQEVVKNAADGH